MILQLNPFLEVETPKGPGCRSGFWYNYVLRDPNTKEVRYVGKARNPRQRFKAHIAAARKNAHTYCARWIRGLLDVGLEPIIELAGEWETESEALGIEVCLIDLFRNHFGARLTNLTDGGGGMSGWTMPEESKRIIGSKVRQKYSDKEWADKRRAELVKSLHSPEATQKRREKQISKFKNPAVKQDFKNRVQAAALSTENRRKAGASISKSYTPKRRAEASERHRALWANPEWRAKTLAARNKKP